MVQGNEGEEDAYIRVSHLKRERLPVPVESSISPILPQLIRQSQNLWN